MSGRKVFRISGADREDYLQNLVTNDVARLKDGLVWAALLTPQGKYLADFFLVSLTGTRSCSMFRMGWQRAWCSASKCTSYGQT